MMKRILIHLFFLFVSTSISSCVKPPATGASLIQELSKVAYYDDIFTDNLEIQVNDGHVTLRANPGKIAYDSGAHGNLNYMMARTRYEKMLAQAGSLISQLDGVKSVTVDNSN